MTESANDTSQKFTWHPDYVGKTFESVRRDLIDDITRDQRAYHMALEEAEKEEFGAFNSVRELEKRWSDYDFGWFDVPPESLANKILAFERDRDHRQVMMSWKEWRAESSPQSGTPSTVSQKTDWRENLSDEQRRKLASGLSVLVLFLLALACGLLYMVVIR